MRINDIGLLLRCIMHGMSKMSQIKCYLVLLKNSNVKYIRVCLSVGVSPANRDGVAASVCGDLQRVVLRSARYNAGIP